MDMMTPYEKLKSSHKPSQYLKPGITFKQLDAQARGMSDNDAALALNNADDNAVRTVTENCRTLKFTDQGFERE